MHFVLLGAMLFAVDDLIASRRGPANQIVVDAAAQKEIRSLYEAASGRPPTEAQFRALRQTWIDNEVLYREGLALGLDRGDPTIRDRVIFKALGTIEADLAPPKIDDAQLRAWFEARRDRYDEPTRFDYQEAALVGEVTEERVRAFVAALNGGTSPDSQAGLRVFKGRPHGSLVQVYGEAFARSLESAPIGEWRAIAAGGSWHAMRLQAIVPGRQVAFEAIRGPVLQDWIDQTMAERRSAAVATIASKYRIRIEEVPQ